MTDVSKTPVVLTEDQRALLKLAVESFQRERGGYKHGEQPKFPLYEKPWREQTLQLNELFVLLSGPVAVPPGDQKQ